MLTRRIRLEVTGVVQGVGFRPTVWRIARELGLRGFVRNTAAGVEIEVEGDRAGDFAGALGSAPPPLARIARVECRDIPPEGASEFVILPSREAGAATEVSPDVATCVDCLREVADCDARRHEYPFTNCTNCGPRYSITLAVPYDRPSTTMAPFAMCADCAREYGDPSDRRFHAQPIACPACGPQLVLRRGDTPALAGPAALRGAVELLRAGGVLALKGLGGFQLAADASHPRAVELLRQRKRRSNKPFALMAADAEAVRRHCHVEDEEQALLESPERPIVLLRRREPRRLPEAVAPSSAELGFMLPNTALHWLLFHAGGGAPRFEALVMTSGNLAEEPIVKDGGTAARLLAPLADAILDHDRGIFMRVDDSVVRRHAGRTLFLRRARGYVPRAIPLAGVGPPVLGCGAELKNTLCLTPPGSAIVSQHIGDLENHETLEFFLETLANLKRVHRTEPLAVAHDLHPGYFSTRWALDQQGMEPHGFQHHWAHIASVIAEEGLAGPVIGVAFDGSGYGADGTIWGGEFLVADLRGFERRGSLLPLPMPGGDGAARNPWRMALAALAAAGGGSLPEGPAVAALRARVGAPDADAVLRIMADRRLSPLTSGAGRLFEAAASLLGIRDRNTFEGEAAMALEAAAGGREGAPLPWSLREESLLRLDLGPAWTLLAAEAGRGRAAGELASRFHATVADAAAALVARIGRETGLRDVALSGGVFQNRLLLAGLLRRIEALGLRAHVNTRVPANDGGISLGQAVLLREKLRRGDRAHPAPT